MANALEFILKLVDQFSPAMKAAATAADSSTARITTDFNKIQSASRSMGSSLSDLHEKLRRVNDVRMNTRIASVFSDATREARRLEQQIDRMENKGRSRGGQGGMVGGLLAGLGVLELGRGTIGQAAQFEQQQISFEVMTGSKAAGNKLLDSLRAEASVTPFETGDLTGASQTLLGFGVAGEKILPTLRQLGDISGGNAEKLRSLALVYGQVHAAEKLQGQDLLQFINTGWNPLQEIAGITGIKMSKLREAMEKGAISSEMVAVAMQNATGPGGRFYEMMKKQSETLTGKWSTLLDNAKVRLLALGEAMKPAVKWLVHLATAAVNSTPTIIGIASVVGVLTVSIYGITWAKKAWAAVQLVLNTVMKANPILLIISLVAAAFFWVQAMVKANKNWGDSLKSLWEIIKAFGRLAVTPFKMMWEQITYFGEVAWLKMKDFFQQIEGKFLNVMKAFELATNGDWSQAWKTATAPIETAASKELKALQENHKKTMSGFTQSMVNDVALIKSEWAKVDFSTKKNGKAKGVNPNTANGAPDKSVFASLHKSVDDSTKSKADSINNGGSRPIIINIGKQVERFEVHTVNMKEGIDELGKMVKEELRRVLYSINGAANA
jgi:tape measure domain-containing protein